MLDRIDRELITLACGDLGESRRPFAALAHELGTTEDEVIERLRGYRQNGALRRFGAVLRHTRAGYRANGMSVWNVPADAVDSVGAALAARPRVSHCYERARFEDWPYNVYGMIHGRTQDEVLSLASEIAAEVGVEDYDVLFSIREFKKTSMTYLAGR